MKKMLFYFILFEKVDEPQQEMIFDFIAITKSYKINLCLLINYNVIIWLSLISH